MSALRRAAAAALLILVSVTVPAAQAQKQAQKQAQNTPPASAPTTAPAPPAEAPSADTLKVGEALLAKNCGSCHAVGRTDTSKRPDAPAFRTLGLRYPIESLEETLGEGIMSGHPDMPEISFDADGVGAIIDYLTSIQQKR